MEEVRLFSMQVKHWWEKLSEIMLEEGFYTKPEYVGYIIAFEHDFRDLLGKVHDLEAENRRLKVVAEAAKCKRDLEIERMEVIRKLANHEISKEFWLEDTVRYEKEHEKAEAELDKTLAALEGGTRK